MAKKGVIFIDLNGGDAVTADKNLTYKVYHNTTLIKTCLSYHDGIDVQLLDDGRVMLTDIPLIEGTLRNLTVEVVNEAAEASAKSNIVAITPVAEAGTLLTDCWYWNKASRLKNPLDITDAIAFTQFNGAVFTRSIDGLFRITALTGSLTGINLNTGSLDWFLAKTYKLEFIIAAKHANIIDMRSYNAAAGGASAAYVHPIAIGRNSIVWSPSADSTGSATWYFGSDDSQASSPNYFIDMLDVRLYDIT